MVDKFNKEDSKAKIAAFMDRILAVTYPASFSSLGFGYETPDQKITNMKDASKENIFETMEKLIAAIKDGASDSFTPEQAEKAVYDYMAEETKNYADFVEPLGPGIIDDWKNNSFQVVDTQKKIDEAKFKAQGLTQTNFAANGTTLGLNTEQAAAIITFMKYYNGLDKFIY